MAGPIRLSLRRIALLGSIFTLLTLFLSTVMIGHARRRTAEAPVEPVCGYWPGWSGIENLFTFGDSWTSTGFRVDGPQPDLAPGGNVIGNPPYPGFTSTNGPIWFEHLATRYNDSGIKAYNLASGGAVVDSALIQQFLKAGIRSLIQQVRQDWVPAYGRRTRIKGPHAERWSTKNSLFAIWIGINDVMRTNASSVLFPIIFNEFEMLLNEMYDNGARNFVFLDVPPVDNSPLGQLQLFVPLPLQRTVINDWNRRLRLLANRFQRRHLDASLSIFSVHKLFRNILRDPTRFSQTSQISITSPEFCFEYTGNGVLKTHDKAASCKGPISKYFWRDTVHPTTHVHEVLAADLGRHLRGIAPSRRCLNPLE